MFKYVLMAMLLVAGCGYESRANEAAGQVKKVVQATPIVCPNFNAVDVSLGVIRNGVGSMSTEDVWLVVENPNDYALFKEAAQTGKIVEFSYDVQRITFCTPDHFVTKVRLADNPDPGKN